MLGLNGLAKKKMDEAIGEEASFKKEGWELLLKTGMKVEDADMEEYLALVKAYYQHPVVRIHVHIRKKDLTYEIEQHAPDDMREMSVVSAPCGEGGWAWGGGGGTPVRSMSRVWDESTMKGALGGAQRIIGQGG
jgi:hypothetical protein